MNRRPPRSPLFPDTAPFRSKADTLPRLRLCVSGGASLPVAVLERFNETFHATIYEGYGLSETSPTATTNQPAFGVDRKSTRLNSSHANISYAVFCLKKKKNA